MLFCKPLKHINCFKTKKIVSGTGGPADDPMQISVWCFQFGGRESGDIEGVDRHQAAM